jgi:hypothetical protein
MRSGCNDGDNGRPFLALDFIGAVMPKDAVGTSGIVLNVSLEDLFLICASQRGELVGMKTWMAKIAFQVTESLPSLFEDRRFRRGLFQRRVLSVRSRRKFDLAAHVYFLACLENEPR